MKCSHCGFEINSDELYCPNCGRKIVEPVQFKKIDNEGSKDDEQTFRDNNQFRKTVLPEKYGMANEKKKSSTGLIMAACILAILLATVRSFFGSGKRYADNKAENTTQIDLDGADDSAVEQQSLTDVNDSREDEAKYTAVPDFVDIPMGAVSFQGHSYYIFDNNCSTWEEAHKYCKSRGGYLAVIESSQEDDFLFEYMTDSGRSEVYFGLSSPQLNGVWKWVDNKTSDYENWGINDDGEVEPNRAAEDEKYAEYDASLIRGRWNDCGFGRDTSAYICEWDYCNPQ